MNNVTSPGVRYSEPRGSAPHRTFDFSACNDSAAFASAARSIFPTFPSSFLAAHLRIHVAFAGVPHRILGIFAMVSLLTLTLLGFAPPTWNASQVAFDERTLGVNASPGPLIIQR